MRELRIVVGNKTQEVRGKQDAVNRATEEISIIDYQIKTQRQMLERLEKDHESLSLRAVKLKQECGDQINGANQLREENEQLGREIKLKEMDIQKCRTEIKKINKIRDGLIKKNKALEELKSDHEFKRREIKSKIEGLEREEHKIKHQVDLHKKTIDDFNRERDVLIQNQGKAMVETQRTLNLLAPYRQIKENLELEIMRAKNEITEIEASSKRTNLEKDMYIREAANLQSQLVDCLTSIRLKEVTIYDCKKRERERERARFLLTHRIFDSLMRPFNIIVKKQMVSADTKLKHQQALYEAVQSDRNLHAKHLIESQAEISEMKRKLRIMNYQINGYKDDIRVKQEYLIKEGSEHARLKKDADMINDEIKTLKSQNELAQAYIRTQLAEEFRLNQFVKEAELERTRQETSLQTLINERDNLSDQLIKQNVELSKVYDKIKSQHTSLLTSEKLYNNRLAEITILYERIGDSRQVISEYKKETDLIEELKFKQCRLSNEVVFEKTRVKALEEQLEYPVNIHRWRKLEGSNPKAFEMIQLVHTLQKKISKKIDEDKALGEKLALHQETYLQCKALLSKQVGPEALEQLSEYEKIHKEKSGQVRHLEAELNMYQAQSKEYKHSIVVLDVEIADLKKRYVNEWFKQHQNYDTSGFSSSQRQTPKSMGSSGGRGHFHVASTAATEARVVQENEPHGDQEIKEGEEIKLTGDDEQLQHVEQHQAPVLEATIDSLTTTTVKGDIPSNLPLLPRLSENEKGGGNDNIQQASSLQEQRQEQQVQEHQQERQVAAPALCQQDLLLEEAAARLQLPESAGSSIPVSPEITPATDLVLTQQQSSGSALESGLTESHPSQSELQHANAEMKLSAAALSSSTDGLIQSSGDSASSDQDFKELAGEGQVSSEQEANSNSEVILSSNEDAAVAAAVDEADAQVLTNALISEAMPASRTIGTTGLIIGSHEAGLDRSEGSGELGGDESVMVAAVKPKSVGALFDDSKPGSAESGNKINRFDE